MTGKLLSALAVAAMFAGAYLLALDLSRRTLLSPGGSGRAAGGDGPQIILRGVEMIEERREGTVYRLVSDDASYSFLAGRVVASVVTLALREREGTIVVTAPVASWNLNEGRIDLPEGASARNARGWTASAPRASIDLKAEVITAGEAGLSGPGVTVAGSNLRWRWHEGTMELDSPRSRIFPRGEPGPGRQG